MCCWWWWRCQGAMVLGRVSTSTIAGGIADYKAFKKHPYVFAYGMVSSQAADKLASLSLPP